MSILSHLFRILKTKTIKKKTLFVHVNTFIFRRNQYAWSKCSLTEEGNANSKSVSAGVMGLLRP